MKKFILLSFMSWIIIATIPLKLYNEKDPEVQRRLSEKMIELTKERQTGCEGAFLLFNVEEEDKNLIDIIVECYKYQI